MNILNFFNFNFLIPSIAVVSLNETGFKNPKSVAIAMKGFSDFQLLKESDFVGEKVSDFVFKNWENLSHINIEIFLRNFSFLTLFLSMIFYWIHTAFNSQGDAKRTPLVLTSFLSLEPKAKRVVDHKQGGECGYGGAGAVLPFGQDQRPHDTITAKEFTVEKSKSTIISNILKKKNLTTYFVAQTAMIFSNFLLILLLLFRWKESGHFPLSNLYESLMFLSWSCTLIHFVLEFKTERIKSNKIFEFFTRLWFGVFPFGQNQRQKGKIVNQRSQAEGGWESKELIMRLNRLSIKKNRYKEGLIGSISSPIAFLTNAFAGFALPIEMQKASPLVPALQSNWLMMHVTVMIISYSALILGSLFSIAFLILINFEHVTPPPTEDIRVPLAFGSDQREELLTKGKDGVLLKKKPVLPFGQDQRHKKKKNLFFLFPFQNLNSFFSSFSFKNKATTLESENFLNTLIIPTKPHSFGEAVFDSSVRRRERREDGGFCEVGVPQACAFDPEFFPVVRTKGQREGRAFFLEAPPHDGVITKKEGMKELISLDVKKHSSSFPLAFGSDHRKELRTKGQSLGGISDSALLRLKPEPTPSYGPLINAKITLAWNFDNLSYRILGIGFPFLTIGILSGAVWANEAWGSYWSWDPKETWALLTWLIFAIYLHARITKGWQGKKPAIIASLGFLTLWICFLGVNLLGEGLHSYGWFSHL